MPTFDAVCKPDAVELRNAVDQANKEIGARFDFKGSDARVEHTDKVLTVYADSDFRLNQVIDVLLNKMTRRSVDVRFLDHGKVEKIGGDKVKQGLTIRNGIPQENAKKIVGLLTNSIMKVQASMPGDAVGVQGAKLNDPETSIAMLPKEDDASPLTFATYRHRPA